MRLEPVGVFEKLVTSRHVVPADRVLLPQDNGSVGNRT